MVLNIKHTRDYLQALDFKTLFNELGWSRAKKAQPETVVAENIGTIQGKEICRIDLRPADEAVFLRNGDFYIRDGNRKRKLTAHEASIYQKQRWK